jgi:orotate phosphoribosyltransferase
LREEGAIVENLFVFINRTQDGLADFEKIHHLKVHSLINVEDILSKVS